VSPIPVAGGVHFIWSTRPGSQAGFARKALAEQSSAANRRPPRWQGDAGLDFIEVFRLNRSYRIVSVNSGGSAGGGNREQEDQAIDSVRPIWREWAKIYSLQQELRCHVENKMMRSAAEVLIPIHAEIHRGYTQSLERCTPSSKGYWPRSGSGVERHECDRDGRIP
jgi:hypothetical protein